MAGAGGGNVPVLFASLGSAGHDARFSVPQPRASCLHESRLIGQRAPPFKTASLPGHWLRASCILNRRGCPLGTAAAIIHSNRTTRRRRLQRQNRGIIFSLSHSPRPLHELSWDLKGLSRGGPAIPHILDLWLGKARLSQAALPSAPAAPLHGRPHLPPLVPRQPRSPGNRSVRFDGPPPLPSSVAAPWQGPCRRSLLDDSKSYSSAKTSGFQCWDPTAPPERDLTLLLRILLD